MKKRVPILMSATVLFALSSCDTLLITDPDQGQEKNLITMNAVWERVSEANAHKTRATEITNINIADFGVYAYYEADKFDQTTSQAQFMNNQKVEKLSDRWSYNPIMYWPSQGTISFFAYAPYSAGRSLVVSTEGMPTFDYSNPASISAQHDLLLSYPQIDKTYEDVLPEGRLPLKFRHALSNIVFKAGVLSTMSDPVKIQSITIGSLKSRAMARFAKNSAIESGWDLNWTVNADANDDSYESSILNEALYDTDIKNSLAPVTITSTDGHMMVIPQDVDQTDLITVVSTVGSQTNTTRVALNSLIAKFEPSKKYVISITVVPVPKVDVTIVCEVEPWTEEEINVPEFK